MSDSQKQLSDDGGSGGGMIPFIMSQRRVLGIWLIL